MLGRTRRLALEQLEDRQTPSATCLVTLPGPARFPFGADGPSLAPQMRLLTSSLHSLLASVTARVASGHSFPSTAGNSQDTLGGVFVVIGPQLVPSTQSPPGRPAPAPLTNGAPPAAGATGPASTYTRPLYG